MSGNESSPDVHSREDLTLNERIRILELRMDHVEHHIGKLIKMFEMIIELR